MCAKELVDIWKQIDINIRNSSDLYGFSNQFRSENFGFLSGNELLKIRVKSGNMHSQDSQHYVTEALIGTTRSIKNVVYLRKITLSFDEWSKTKFLTEDVVFAASHVHAASPNRSSHSYAHLAASFLAIAHPSLPSGVLIKLSTWSDC